jgi:hypothetical protein
VPLRTSVSPSLPCSAQELPSCSSCADCQNAAPRRQQVGPTLLRPRDHVASHRRKLRVVTSFLTCNSRLFLGALKTSRGRVMDASSFDAFEILIIRTGVMRGVGAVHGQSLRICRARDLHSLAKRWLLNVRHRARSPDVLTTQLTGRAHPQLRRCQKCSMQN